MPIALAISPALLFPTRARLALIAPLVFAWLLGIMTAKPALPRMPLDVTLVALLSTVFVSLFATFDIEVSLGKVCGVLLGAIVYWTISRWLTTATRLKVGAACFVLAGALLAVIGTLGINGVGKVEGLGNWVAEHLVTIRGLPGAESGFNPNPVAGTLVLFIPLQIALLLTPASNWLLSAAKTGAQRRTAIGTQWLLLLVTAGTFSIMQSRGAWLGLIAASGSVYACRSRSARRVLAGAAVVLLIAGYVVGWRNLLQEAIVRSGSGSAETRLFVAEHDLSVRMQIWSKALRGIRDYPITGMGMNTFRHLMPARYNAPLEPTPVQTPHAHNNLLQTALDLGLPGLVAYLSIWLLAGAMLLRVQLESLLPEYAAIATALGIGLVAHFLFGITDAIPLGAKVGVLFWLTLALVTGLHRIGIASLRKASTGHLGVVNK